MDANYYKLFIILKSICPQLSHWRIDKVISSLRINHTIYTATSLRVVEHQRGPAQVRTTKSGKMTLQSNQDQLIGHLRRGSTSLIGLEPSLFNLLFSFIVLLIQPTLVDSIPMRTQELSKRRMESSSALCKLESQCFSTSQEWEQHSSTLRAKDLVTSSEIKLLDYWCHL